MPHLKDDLSRIVTLLATFVALLVAVVLPLGYVLVEYEDIIVALEFKARVKASALEGLIAGNPDSWMFAENRMQGLISREPVPLDNEMVQVLDAQGGLLTQNGQDLKAPVFRVGYPLYDADRVVGRLEVIGSGRELVYKTLAAALLGLLLGTMVFMIMRVLPLRALRQVTHELRAEKDRAETTLRSISDAVVTTDAQGRVIRMNPAGLAMIEADTLDQVAGRPVLETVASEYRAAYAELHKRVIAGELMQMRYEVLGLKGTRRWLETRAVPLLDNDETIHLAVARDITEQKQAETARASLEAQLRESQKMQAIGTLAGGIAHDFNNIIAAILGNIELAREDLSTNPQALESLEEIRKAGSRARDLVQQILAFSRRERTERKRRALAPIIGESVRLLRATLPARVSIDVNCDADVPAVLADTTQIQQVLINLATNAVQAMRGEPGRVAIRLDSVILDTALAREHSALSEMLAAHPGRMARLAVSDTGPGMDTATLARIFEPFFTTKPPGEGTGLGLSVVHGIVQSHEGAITVASQPGKGSTFTLYLPAAAAQAGAPDDESIAPATAAPQSGDQHILYIDDDKSLVFLVERLLTRRGFRVSGHVNQHEALAALRAAPAEFDLVVTDYNMPGMSGLGVAREVRAIRADLPVVIASGFLDEALRAQADGAGVRELIFKADSAEDFCEILQRLAQTARQKQKFS